MHATNSASVVRGAGALNMEVWLHPIRVTMWEFPKIRVTLLGVLTIRILLFRVL